MAFERGDVGADRNIAAVLGAPFIDLEPAAIAKPRLVGARPGKRPFAERDLRLNDGGRSFRHHLHIRRSGGDRIIREMMEFLELGIAHDKTVVGVPKNESLRYGLDGIAQAQIGRGGALRKGLLFGYVDGDPHEVRGGAHSFRHEFGARPQPDPLALHVLHPENMIDRIGLRTGQRLGHCREVAILRMNQRIDIAEGQKLAGGCHAKDLCYRR